MAVMESADYEKTIQIPQTDLPTRAKSREQGFVRPDGAPPCPSRIRPREFTRRPERHATGSNLMSSAGSR